MRDMAFPFSPAALADFTRAAIGQVLETAAAAATVPVRVMGVLGQTELLVSRMTMLAVAFGGPRHVRIRPRTPGGRNRGRPARGAAKGPTLYLRADAWFPFPVRRLERP